MEMRPVVVEVDRSPDRREEAARLRTGRLGLDVFDAFPACTLTLMNGRHRLRLHKPAPPDSK
jgi:hypothetical protein